MPPPEPLALAYWDTSSPLEERDQALLTAHLVSAALLLLGVLRRGPLDLRSEDRAYVALPTAGLYVARDFRRARCLLERAELVEHEEGRLRLADIGRHLLELAHLDARRLLVIAYLRRVRPPWLGVVVSGKKIETSYIPQGAEALLNELFPDRDELIRALLAAGGHVDPDRRAEIGDEGERIVVEALREQRRDAGRADLAAAVFRVSQLSDSFGYDVAAPRLGGGTDHNEVKVARRAGETLVLHLSRHQVQVGREDPDWRLIVCAGKPGRSLEVVGWCRADEDLAAALPRNVEEGSAIQARWDSVELTLPRDHLIHGLPPLRLEDEAVAKSGVDVDR